MKKSSYDGHLTRDMATCQKCGVTQKKVEALKQKQTLRKLKGKPSDPSLPVDVHSEAELLEQAQAPWFCVDDERCVRHRIEAAVQADRQRIWSEVEQVMMAPASGQREWVDPPGELTKSLPRKEHERYVKGLGKDQPKESKVTPKLAEAKRQAAKKAKAAERVLRKRAKVLRRLAGR